MFLFHESMSLKFPSRHVMTYVKSHFWEASSWFPQWRGPIKRWQLFQRVRQVMNLPEIATAQMSRDPVVIQ